MIPEDKPFTSRQVDAQIERLSEPSVQQTQPTTASSRLLRQLRQHYRQQAAEQRERSLARAWERIAQHPAQPDKAGAAASNHATQRPSLHLTALRSQTGLAQPDHDSRWAIPQHQPGAFAMKRKRVRGLAAFMTLVAVVALFAVLLHQLIPGHTSTGKSISSGTATASHTATATAVPQPTGQWVNILTTDGRQWNTPMLFPGNTRILYQNQTPNTTTTITIRRSDDGGATWHQLAAPTGLPTDFDSVGFFVSPLDPNVVFLTLTIYQALHPDACQLTPTGNALARFSGGASCGIQYYSADGGQHWSRLALPIAGALGAPYGGHLENPNSDEILRPQGQRLYSAISDSTVVNVTFGGPSARILASDDGGKTWKLVDADLHASGQNTCDFAPTPTGSTIFALTRTDSCYAPQDPNASQFLWRSDDGGAHWSQVSKLPVLAGDLTLALAQNGAPVLYAHKYQVATQPILPNPGATPTKSPQAAKGDAEIIFSQDEGHTWQQAPASGIVGPNPSSEYLDTALGPVGALADGSVVGLFPTEQPAFIFAAWKPGDTAWRPLTPALEHVSQVLSFLTTPDGNGKITCWAITFDPNGTINIFRYDQQ